MGNTYVNLYGVCIHDENTDCYDMQTKAQKYQLDHEFDYQNNDHFIGKSFSKMRSNDTKKEFKARIEKRILKMFPDYKGKFRHWDEEIIDC